MEKYCEQWEDMQVGLKTWQAFKDHFFQAYRWYHIRKKATAVSHGYGASANHAQKKESQVFTVDVLQALACAAMEEKEAMANLTIINITLSQSLTQAQDTIMMLSNQLQALEAQSKAKKQTTKKLVLDKKKGEIYPKNYFQNHRSNRSLEHTRPICRY